MNARSDKGILMHQRKYALDLLSELGLKAAKPATTLTDYNIKMTSRQFDEHVKQNHTTDDPPINQATYQKLIGKLLYLTMTKSDIAFCVQTLSQFLQDPKKSHIEAVLRVVSWPSSPQTRRSVTGYFVMIGNSIVSWKSKKQITVSKSSAEAEFTSLAVVTAKLIWILGLMKEIESEVLLVVDVFSDSKSAQ
ncbi:secreted RxLR effector protein 161-like [Capsicum annuum]|uniref:secreted RxLR effector protein 161-like n=1 Tax=Capsicum annuum TaxID=4072 RepID=UPI0007BFEBD5|nr:secreted RxLR effector protein 161-like [Capsicum annuum]